MILYLDTSAFVPLLVTEPTSDVCRRLWDAADDVVSSVVLRPEVASALWRAEKVGRITGRQAAKLRDAVGGLTDQMSLIVVDDALATRAAGVATTHGLRGYDAVHAATALTVLTDDGLAASGDAQLLAAWAVEGLATSDLSGRP